MSHLKVRPTKRPDDITLVNCGSINFEVMESHIGG